MATVHFSVVNTLEKSVSENVLVFLMPVGANPDYQFFAWQSLHVGPRGGSQPFNFVVDLAVQAVNMTTGSASEKLAVNPGQVVEVVYESEKVEGLVVQPSKETGRVTPNQVGVINRLTRDPVLIATRWYVNGELCCSIPGLNLESIQLFELQPRLYFFAAIPTEKGFNYTYQQVSRQTTYTIPSAKTTDVTVTWSRPGGEAGPDTFTFDPPSAADPKKDVVEGIPEISQFFAQVRGYKVPAHGANR